MMKLKKRKRAEKMEHILVSEKNWKVLSGLKAAFDYITFNGVMDIVLADFFKHNPNVLEEYPKLKALVK